ncbi:DNA-binding transcriptional regulator, MarR family [Marivirga sericea]|uniref:DNA-binding transcriptional regulator, MarR family n=1 Tax=Marivirga sericea TaxID=1028 RepID=A0A1X7KFN0_9BACT|nr:MarR family transcriptional regulator [Marivirga sericea]SMG39743.1 DNA-binding transcriptional regulator, MarR family [Marivirga sericea]
MKSGSEREHTNSLIGQTFATLLSCQQKLSYNISRAMKVFDITRQQYEVLAILNDHSKQPMNLNKVKSYLRENVPDISRIVQRLVEKGLINRSRQENDRRNSAISINDDGKALIVQIEPIIKEKMSEFFGILTSEELHELSRIISKVNKNKA